MMNNVFLNASIYRGSKMEPSMDPCGTLHTILAKDETWSPLETENSQ